MSLSQEMESKDAHWTPRPQTLAESDLIIAAIFDFTPNAILIIDPLADGRGQIRNCNAAAVKMYGRSSKAEMLATAYADLFCEPQDVSALLLDVRQLRQVEREEKHVSLDGSPIQTRTFYSVLALAERDYLISIQYNLTEAGALRDGYEMIRALYEESPDGFVVIDPTDVPGAWPILACNHQFAKMNGYSGPSELKGRDINIVTADPEPRVAYYERLKGGATTVEAVHKRKDGSVFPIQSSTCLVRIDGKERVIGIDRDMTKERELTQVLDDLRRDVGRTFHTPTTTLMQAKLAMRTALKALGADPFPSGPLPSSEDVWANVSVQRDRVVASLRAFLASRKQSHAEDALSEKDWEQLATVADRLDDVKHDAAIEQRPPLLALYSNSLLEILGRVSRHRIRRETVRSALQETLALAQLCATVALRKSIERIVETDFFFRDVRERVLTGRKEEESEQVLLFLPLVQEAVSGLSEYAAERRIQLHLDGREDLVGIKVKGVAQQIVRAVNNLLNNAIKYSWSRHEHKPPWITIRLRDEGPTVSVAIEDHGVPIPQDEKELIFSFGYRSRYAGERGRVGTGIGLSEAKTIAERHRGSIEITSEAAPVNVAPDALRSPHLVTAVLRLPVVERALKVDGK